MIPEQVIQQVIQKKLNSYSDTKEFFSSTRDIFNARLQSYIAKSKKWLESAIIGEIGNNTFDHNFQFEPDFPRGVYFNDMFLNDFIVLSDFGMGLKNSLLKIIPTLETDLDAVTIAFTQRVSGRHPELRGNGLKFVLKNLKDNNWNMYFQSGTGICKIARGKHMFIESKLKIPGCLAILTF